MDKQGSGRVAAMMAHAKADLLDKWMALQQGQVSKGAGRISGANLRDQSARFLDSFAQAVGQGLRYDARNAQWQDVRDVLADVSSERAAQSFSTSDTATFIFSLKQPLFEQLRKEAGAANIDEEIWSLSQLLDALGLYTTEVYQKAREEVIARQQEEMLELSTPVVRLWEGVVALPLIGTLDSARTQVVMESLLTEVIASRASIAIIDITGVPTVDTLVAQHLLKTVAAARLMGVECLISGIRPQIAQTMVHLGIDLTQVTTKASLADAFALALRKLQLVVVRAEGRPARS